MSPVDRIFDVIGIIIATSYPAMYRGCPLMTTTLSPRFLSARFLVAYRRCPAACPKDHSYQVPGTVLHRKKLAQAGLLFGESCARRTDNQFPLDHLKYSFRGR